MKKLFVFLLIAMPFMACAMKRSYNEVDNNNCSNIPATPQAFLTACNTGDIQLVRSILPQDSTLIRSTNPMGHTGLHLAGIAGHDQVVRFLLSQGADVDAKTSFGDTPLYCACEAKRENIALLLMQANAQRDIKNNDGYAPLQQAVNKGLHAIAYLLLDADADVNGVTPEGTLLHTALLLDDNQRMAKLILQYNPADIDFQNLVGTTPLMLASFSGNANIVRALLDRDADPNMQDDDGEKALGYSRNQEIENLLRPLTQTS